IQRNRRAKHRVSDEGGLTPRSAELMRCRRFESSHHVAGKSLRGQLAGSSAQGTLASMYQATNTANANTITPSQYQPRSASSSFEASPFSREGTIQPSPAVVPFGLSGR